MQGLLNALEASSCWTIIWTSLACAVKEYPVRSVWIALAVVAIIAGSIVKRWDLLGEPGPPGRVSLEHSLHSFYEAVQYGSILVLVVLCLHAIAGECCRVSDRDGVLAFSGVVISVILFVAALVTHNKTLRDKLYGVLVPQPSSKPAAADQLSPWGMLGFFGFLFVSLGTVGTLMAITGGLTSSVFAFLLAGFVSVSATVTERALVPVITSVFCITVAFVTVLAPAWPLTQCPPMTTSEVMALGKDCRAWMYFLMFSSTLALAAGADVRRNRP